MSMERQAFAALLHTFTAAGCANDGARFAGLFTEDGSYKDDFFGLFRGRAEIAAMLQRFHDTGEDYRWDFRDLVTDGTLGYAAFRFSFRSKMPGYEGRPVLITGISRFRFAGGLTPPTARPSTPASPWRNSAFRPNASNACSTRKPPHKTRRRRPRSIWAGSDL
jgi:hypothetical protein